MSWCDDAALTVLKEAAEGTANEAPRNSDVSWSHEAFHELEAPFEIYISEKSISLSETPQFIRLVDTRYLADS